MSDLNKDEITEEMARQGFRDHLEQKAQAARLKYGLYIDTETILRMLQDETVVRYPTSIHFDADSLQENEFAFAKPLGFHASDGYCLIIHQHFESQQEILPLLISYHIPVINYGNIAEPAYCELFGSTLLGLEIDAYYQALCELVDSIPDR